MSVKPNKAMVLAAGLGVRMRPLTDNMPKPLVRVAGQPLLDHVLDKLGSAGVTEAVVNVHYLPDQIIEHTKGRTRPRVIISDERDQVLGTGGGVVKALPLQREVLGDPAGTAVPFQPTVFMNVRGLVGNRIGEAIQLAFAIAAVIAVATAFRYRHGSDVRLLRALFFACSVSASPYMGAYDLLPLTFAAVALLAGGQLDTTGRRLAQLVFWTPALQLLFGNLQIPGPGFIAPVFAAYLMLKLFAPIAGRAGQDKGLAAAG